MPILIAFLVVTASTLGGFALAGGNLLVLWQPAEVIIIIGVALGSMYLGVGGFKGFSRIGKDIRWALQKDHSSEPYYTDLLSLIYMLIDLKKREGDMKLEGHIEEPEKSDIFQQYPLIASDPDLVTFVCNYLRILSTSNAIDADNLDRLIDKDIRTRKKGRNKSVQSLLKAADSMPAYGIVAAVMGVVLVMSFVGQVSNAVLGFKIGAALVGTFLGILIGYGYLNPLASFITIKIDKESLKLEVLRAVIVEYVRNQSPKTAVEFGRNTLDPAFRPDFNTLEERLRAARSGKIASMKQAA